MLSRPLRRMRTASSQCTHKIGTSLFANFRCGVSVTQWFVVCRESRHFHADQRTQRCFQFGPSVDSGMLFCAPRNPRGGVRPRCLFVLY